MQWKVRGGKPFRVMHVYLSIAVLERVARSQSETDTLPLFREISGARDETISQIMRLLLAAAQHPVDADRLFVEGLAQSLAAHVLAKYVITNGQRRSIPALPGHRLRTACDFLQMRLAETFNLAEAAEAAGLSQFHFSRLFKQATGLSTSQYFIRKRIEEA